MDDLGRTLINANTKGTRIVLTGRIIDGTGTPLKDALVEIWQADADGHYDHPRDGSKNDPAFQAFGKVIVGADGGYRYPVEYVNQVQRQQSWHLPDPVDPVQVPDVFGGLAVVDVTAGWGATDADELAIHAMYAESASMLGSRGLIA